MVEPFLTTVRRLVALSAPVALAELGWMAMSVVDTIMVGPLGPPAIGAIGIGNSVYYFFAIACIGLLLGLDTLVAQAFGAGKREDCHHSLAQGTYVALILSPILIVICLFFPPLFRVFGVVPEVSTLAGQFIQVLGFSTLPLLLYAAFRRYLQAVGHTHIVTFALLSANLVNWFGNWLLIQGRWGFPALGVRGSALSTCVARAYMAATLMLFVWATERRFFTKVRRFDLQRVRELIRIGAPAAGQISFEIGAFSMAGLLAARLNANALAAHQIALNCAAFTYMVPLGVSSAAAVAVGHAVGAGQPRLAKRSGFAALCTGCGFMSIAAVTFLLFPGQILGIYTQDRDLIVMGSRLLAVAAAFQLFDGMQTVLTGALRGKGETRLPMLSNLAGYWLIGLPIGYVLCFHSRYGVFGLWWGLTIALIVIALVLLYTWQKSFNDARA